MKIPSYHKSLEYLHVRCEKPRAYFVPFASLKNAKSGIRENSEYLLNLCGEWQFRYLNSFEDIEEDFIDKAFLPANNDQITVPMNWQMLTDRNYDEPLYSNLKYPFPTDPPYVPDENPCGIYSKEFAVPESLFQRDLFLNFEGVASAFYVWINGEFAGYSQVSHCTSEFNISEFVVKGINRIVVLVLKWCDGSYLEDQDFFRLSGIFRDVYLLARSHNHIADVFVKTLLNEELTKVELIISVTLSSPVSIMYSLFSPDGIPVANGEANNQKFSIFVNNPELWNDEIPQLYDLYLSVTDEVILLKIGIRRLAIEKGVILLNGKAVKARGVNRHDFNPELGYTTPYKQMQKDLHILKQNNCNTIRTSHYPNDPRFIEMCDELGFLVINEADLETHGMGYNTDTDWDWFRWSKLSISNEWRESYVDRAERLFERDKNHACVMMWSLGNESGIGENHRAMAEYIRNRDNTALIHYENAHKEFKAIPAGECFSDISDVESRMYADVDYCKKYLNDSNNSKPLFLCEYVDSMTTGDVYAYWDLVQEYENFFGGCIWEMTDHAVGKRDGHNNFKFYYGGDFGDYPNDGICCLDGLVYPDRRSRPGLLDMKRVYQPYKTTFNEDYSVAIESFRFFSNMSDLDLKWKIECDGKLICDGVLPQLNIEPREIKDYQLFNARDLTLYGDCYLTLSFIQNKNTPWAQSGTETGFDQFKLDMPKRYLKALKSGILTFNASERYIKIISDSAIYTFDKAYGNICSIISSGKEKLAKPISFKLWRAPTNNGGGIAKIWHDCGIDHIKQKLYSCEIREFSNERAEILLNISLGGPSSPPVIKAAVKYIFFESGELVISIDGKVKEGVPPLPRIGLEIVMPEGNDQIEFFGYGPNEAYVDRHKAEKIGKYAMRADDNFEHYIRPQENSSHYGTRWGTVGGSDGSGLFFSGYDLHDFCFNASHYSAEMLTVTEHDFDLLPAKETYVNLDWRMNSISENIKIAALETGRILNDKIFCFSFKIKPIDLRNVNPFDILNQEL